MTIPFRETHTRTAAASAVSAPIDVVLDGQVSKPGLAAYAAHLRDLPHAGTVQEVATRDGAPTCG